jgi:hypothetical protein
MFLDADDRILPEKLAEQLAVFRVRPEVGLVYTGVRYIDVDGAPLPQRGWARLEGEALPHLVVSNRFPPHSPLVSREVLEQVGGFDEGMVAFGRGAEDWDLWLRIARRGVPFACVDRPLAEYRVRPDAMHQDPAPMTASSLRVLDKAFGDPALPAEIAALRPLAYQRAYLVAAGDYYRVGDRAAGSRWFRAAVRERPELVTEFESLAEFCRSLLPLGYQRGTIMAAEWRRLARTLRTALTDLFADSALDEEVSRLRWPAERAFWRAVLPLAARRAKVALGGGGRRARLRADHLRLLEFERATGSLVAARG